MLRYPSIISDIRRQLCIASAIISDWEQDLDASICTVAIFITDQTSSVSSYILKIHRLYETSLNESLHREGNYFCNGCVCMYLVTAVTIVYISINEKDWYVYGITRTTYAQTNIKLRALQAKLGSFIHCFSFDNSAPERDNDNYIIYFTYVYIYKWCYKANKFSAQYGYEILVIINNYLNAGYPFSEWLYWLRWYTA